ncbi:3025_t:CDS:2 [Racocetra fulgida]|uniref:Geranylgeranyl transferase type-2 subunit beta n=1 Tax=Racocetra fulgida TaxID=60492 RepID=A0A9N8ZRG1_9GLOM|nr:3025_t:CDS:2 [Racocetra fulgida]
MEQTEKSSELFTDLHVKYIQSLDTDDLEYWLTEHLRLSGVYWGLTALDLMNNVDALKREDVVKYVVSCQHDNGHDPHLLYTLYAVQILVIEDSLDAVNVEKIVESFTGDEWGEIDTRFSYSALSCLSLLKRLDAVDVKKAIEFIMLCKNFDGGFGSTPGAESHAGQIFCCVGALAIVNSLHLVDADLLGWWLCERQLKNGGLNGRPEKLEDEKLIEFVLAAQVTNDLRLEISVKIPPLPPLALLPQQVIAGTFAGWAQVVVGKEKYPNAINQP